jgi:hypothetical protein
MSVLLILSVDGNIATKNWRWPQPIESIVVDEREANVIEWIYKHHPKYKVNFWIFGCDFWCKLENYNIRFIRESNLIEAFEKIYGGDRESSASLYYILKNNIKQCYREEIEKNIPSDYDYDPEEDTLNLSKLVIKDDQLLVDPNQPLPKSE